MGARTTKIRYDGTETVALATGEEGNEAAAESEQHGKVTSALARRADVTIVAALSSH